MYMVIVLIPLLDPDALIYENVRVAVRPTLIFDPFLQRTINVPVSSILL